MTSGMAEWEHLRYENGRRAFALTGQWYDPEMKDTEGRPLWDPSESVGTPLESGREKEGASPAAAGPSAPPGAPRRPVDPPTAARPLRPPGPGPSGGSGSA